MNFDTECALLIQQYRKDKLNWISTVEDILAEPRYERVWEWWKSLAHFKRGPYESLSDVPADYENEYVSTMADVNTLYHRQNGKWVKVQEMRYEDMKSIYGEE